MSNIGRDKAAVVEFDPESGKETKVLFEQPDVDVSGSALFEKAKSYYVCDLHDVERRKEIFRSGSLRRFTIRWSETARVRRLCCLYQQAEDTFIVRTITDRSLGAFYLYDSNSGDLNQARRPQSMAERRTASRDETHRVQIARRTDHPRLSHFAERQNAKDLPIVVNPHGGPWARDEWGFNPEVQFLANRGFGVLQMNFRGSTGYGRKFWEAGFGSGDRACRTISPTALNG